MKMWKQVWHVMKKDARQFRWLLAAIVGSTAMATFTAMSTAVHEGIAPLVTREFAIQGASSIAMIWLAVLLTVLVVQADSPSRSDAFWASRPYQPLAVLLAKGLLIFGVAVAIPMGAEVLALASHQVATANMVPVLMEGALMQMTILLGAAVLAALTADLATFCAAAIGTAVGYTALGFTMERIADGAAYNEISVLEVAALSGLLGFAVLVHQYQTKNVRRSVWATAIGSVIGISLLGAITMPSGTARVDNIDAELVRTDVIWGDFDVEPMPRHNAGAGQAWALRTTIHIEGVDPHYEYALSSSSARLTLSDGSQIRTRVRSGPMLTHATGGLVATPARDVSLSGSEAAVSDAEWEIEPLVNNGLERLVVAELTQAQLDLLRAEGGRLELINGRVDVLAAEVLTTVPLELGSVTKIPGQRFRVESLGTVGSAGPLATVRWEEVHGFESGGYSRFDSDYTAFAFVDPTTRVGVMAPTSNNFAFGHTGVMIAGWSTANRLIGVETPQVFQDGELVPARSSEWLANSELLVIDVEPIGDYWLEVGTDVTEVEVPGDEANR